MKVKMNLYISNPEEFARDPHSSCAYAMSESRLMDDDWIFAGEVEFDVDVDTSKVIKAAKDQLDDAIGKHTTAINVLEQRKNELLCLTHEGQS